MLGEGGQRGRANCGASAALGMTYDRGEARPFLGMMNKN